MGSVGHFLLPHRRYNDRHAGVFAGNPHELVCDFEHCDGVLAVHSEKGGLWPHGGGTAPGTGTGLAEFDGKGRAAFFQRPGIGSGNSDCRADCVFDFFHAVLWRLLERRRFEPV